ncbi:carboxypeptidase S [Pholiota conissans]|uniref:Carboxypeptidase S n=1 Tax=Pholiota conissans TaxID=109636 RepID=A0A9P5YXI8_9AGAR|nr:carboxypeptidase S [Pholiota conissans]
MTKSTQPSPKDPFASDHSRASLKWGSWRRLLALLIGGLWAITFITKLSKTLRNDFPPLTTICEQPSPAGSPSNLSDFVNEPGFALAAAKRLAGAVKIPTMSFDDMGPVDKDERWAPFEVMHKYLRNTFPLTHSTLNLTVIGGYSLVYTWPGSTTNAKPLMLTGHIDVVPSLTALDRWTYPPFSGTIDEEWIYGRGAGDCKNNVIGIMTAVEHLIRSSWKPARTIVLAFGQDEEISGPRGATNIGIHLEEIYGKNGIAMIVDEGGMNLDTIYGKEFALPGIAEKGYLNVEVQVDMLGGHSSIPSPHTSIGILSKIVSAIEDSTIFQPHLERKSPIWGYLSCVAAHGDSSKVPSWIRKGVSSKEPDMDDIAERFAKTSVNNRYLVQTSKAATIFHAGLKSNALPESARVLFNSRVDIFSSPAKTKEAYLSLVKPVAEKYSLLLDGVSLSDAPSIGNISILPNLGHEPSPISPFAIDSDAWLVFSKAVQAAFGSEVVTAPSAMTGNTDTRYYWNLSENIYRWSPTRAGTKLNIHTVDEKIKIATHVEGIKFYTELILKSDAQLEST